MKNFCILSITLLFITISSVVKAQTEFGLSGLGRVLVSSDQIGGKLMEGDTVTPNKGVGGYLLFDLGTNLKVKNNFNASAILRVKNVFGGFFGEGTSFEFRQVLINGKIGKYVSYDLGDVYLSLTPYTLYSFDEMYNDYEADIFKMRRDIVQYENFMHKNDWRLQGVHAYSKFSIGSNELQVRAFGTRTNATNDIDVPDRVLAGSRVSFLKSKLFSISGNYVGMLDIPIEDALVIYKNNVYTADGQFNLDKDQFAINVNAEIGASKFDYYKASDDSSYAYDDHFYDVKATAGIKPAKLKLTLGYKDIGPQFSSPSAQTRRINVNTTPDLFGNIRGARNQMLFDRFTHEGAYNMAIAPVLYAYLPKYNVLFPYGPATPNRKGFTVALKTDTSLKVLDAELRADMFSEVLGEGIEDLRKFTALTGGAVLHVGKLAGLKNAIDVNGGIRYEKSTRDGKAPVDFSTSTIDAGARIEFVKNVDLLAGVKMLSSSGNEFLAERDGELNYLKSFPVYSVDVNESVYSFGARVRFSGNSYFTINYNLSKFKDNKTEAASYDIKQLFFNYTIIL